MVQPVIRLVALDLDGTLLTDQKQLTARTRAALLAAILHILSHSLTKPMLFLSGSELIAASGHHEDFLTLRGAAHRNSLAAVVFISAVPRI